MMLFNPPSLVPIIPELSLAVFGMILLLLGVVRGEEKGAFRPVLHLGVMALAVTGLLVCMLGTEGLSTFNGMFVADGFASYMKILILAGAGFSLVMAAGSAETARVARFEYPVLVLFSTLGMMLMISANDLMSLYVGIELQSLPLYVLAAIQRDTVRSTEAGLKYFILGALSSGLLLYGASLVYGFTGTTNFGLISTSIGSTPIGPGIIFGMVLMLSGLAFKVSAVPFHMWTPDVYEGAPTPVTAFFAIVPKIAALALLTRLFADALGGMIREWQQVLMLISIASMALGAVAAIGQQNIKRLFAYSSIGHMGYALVGLAAAGFSGLFGLSVYLAVYMVSAIGAFCVVLMMRRGGQPVENVSDLAGLARTQPLLALAMAIMMFSMAGIPPLAGFFGKLLVFQAAVRAGFYGFAVIGVITSVIAAYYYLRIVKVMYFDEAGDTPLDRPVHAGLKFTLSLSSVLLVLFILMPGPLLTSAEAAAKALLL